MKTYSATINYNDGTSYDVKVYAYDAKDAAQVAAKARAVSVNAVSNVKVLA